MPIIKRVYILIPFILSSATSKQSIVVEVRIMVLSGNKGEVGRDYRLEKGMREVSEMMKII